MLFGQYNADNANIICAVENVTCETVAMGELQNCQLTQAIVDY